MKKIFLSESQLKTLKLNENISRYLESLIQHSFDVMEEYKGIKEKISNNLKNHGLTLPFKITTFGEWNIAVDIPASAIKTYSQELEDNYTKKFIDSQKYGGFGYNNFYDTGFLGLSNLYSDAYENGAYSKQPMPKDWEYYNIVRNRKGVKYDHDTNSYYQKIMPQKEDSFTAFRNEILEIYDIFKKSGYLVQVSNVFANDTIMVKGKKRFTLTKCVRFEITSKELYDWQMKQISNLEYLDYKNRDEKNNF